MIAGATRRLALAGFLSVLLVGSALSVPSAASAQLPDCSKATAESVYERSDLPERIEAAYGSFTEDARELFQVNQHFCADLTGDGSLEMVVMVVCCTVSSPRPWAIYQAAPDGRMRVAFAAIRVSYVAPLRLRGTGPNAKDVVERRAILRRRDAGCCPSGGSRYRYIRWNGSAFYTAERKIRRKR